MISRSNYVLFGLLSIVILCSFFNYKENFELNKIDGSPFTYKGVFKDSGSRDLPKHIGSVGESTAFADAAKCHVKCKDYKYFGLQYWGECWCGNSYGRHGEKKTKGATTPFTPTSKHKRGKKRAYGGWQNFVFENHSYRKT